MSSITPNGTRKVWVHQSPETELLELQFGFLHFKSSEIPEPVLFGGFNYLSVPPFPGWGTAVNRKKATPALPPQMEQVSSFTAPVSHWALVPEVLSAVTCSCALSLCLSVCMCPLLPPRPLPCIPPLPCTFIFCLILAYWSHSMSEWGRSSYGQSSGLRSLSTPFLSSC